MGLEEDIDMILGVRVTYPQEFPRQAQYEYKATFRTVVLTAANQYLELLSGPDPTRCHAIVTAVDGVVVLTDSQSRAQDNANSTTALPNPQGALIAQNQPTPIPEACNEIYVSAPLTGNNISRVSVISIHKVKAL